MFEDHATEANTKTEKDAHTFRISLVFTLVFKFCGFSISFNMKKKNILNFPNRETSSLTVPIAHDLYKR